MADELNIEIGADPSGLRQGLSESESLLQGFSQRISSSLERIGSIGQQLAGLGATMTAGITVPIVGLATASVKAYGDIQALQLGLESVAGSATYAGKQFKDMQEVAKLPGLGLQEAVKGSINLQAIGLSAGSAKNVLLQFGNAVATVGKGRVELDRAIYGVSQLANTEFPLGEDLNIIADALPQVRTLLGETFGATRSDDLKKMGVSSKQVLDAIITGLEKLPRVSGGIKNAFENLKDSTQQSLSRIGKSIDDAFDISGLINKLTDGIDKIITSFEELSPTTQKVILGIAGLAAATGPLLLALGGVMAILPIVSSGISALVDVMIALVSPVGLVVIGLAALTAGILYYIDSQKDATREQDSWNDSLVKATISGEKEVSALAKLYEASQNQKLSIEERNKAIDQMQKEYPAYFENLSNEAILAGNAGKAYQALRVDIINASKARAAQAELDRRASKDLEEDLERRKKFQQAVKDFKFPKEVKLASGGFDDKSFKKSLSADEVKKIAQDQANALAEEGRKVVVERQKRDADLLNIIGSGQDAVLKLNQSGVDNLITASKGGTAKIKKAQEQQLKEVFPIGSIEELNQRAALLLKSINASNNDIIKIRKVDTKGNDIDKKGNPFLTGEILSREEAWKRLEQINANISLLDAPEIKPIDTSGLKMFRTELTDLAATIDTGVIKIGDSMFSLPQKLAFGVNSFTTASVAMEEAGNKLDNQLSRTVSDGLADSIQGSMSAIGGALVNGENVLKAVGNSLLSSFGKILGQLGQQLIEYGVGLLAVKISMKTLNPYVAIAAGAALSILGSALTSSISNQSSSIGGGGGSVSTSTGANTPNFSSNNSNNAGQSGGEFVFRISGTDLVSVFNRNVSLTDRVTAG